MADLVLLGDSVIDNGPYVAPGEPDVAAQIRAALPGRAVAMRAVDGHVTADVIAGLDADPLPEGAAVFLSAGGNDALAHLGLLADPTPMALSRALAVLGSVRDAFRADYARLLDRLRGRRVLVATVYHPDYGGAEAALQAPAEAALGAFDDVIQREALARGFSILELRALFTESAHYANPIEPSALGGERLARVVAEWFDR